ncbi:MAG: DUF6364 family protein [Thermoanaerobaculaceae bacterium]|jgi:hypothetical protein|nr:DUF6364 family protein [Thermoanaerobaculaceae bacterium]
MDTQNVTLSLPKALLLQARHVAVDRGISLSRLLAEYMERAVRQSERSEEARKRLVALLDRGFELGVGEKPTWTRDELHER